MKRALVIASVASMIDQFNMPNIRLMQELGYQVDVACNFEQGSTCTDERVQQLKRKLTEMNVAFYQIDFARNVLKVNDHFKAARQLEEIARRNCYDMMHCHSPIGGLLGRLVFRKYRKQGTRVIYTAHGFHFFKGSPLQNWLLYYPVEKLCSYFTDILITINQEDFALAKKRMKAKRVDYISGVGIDLGKFGRVSVDRAEKRRELGIPENALLLLSVGELNERKNHQVIIRAMAQLNDPEMHYIIVGKGESKTELEQLADTLGMKERIHLLGFRTDVGELCGASDIFCFPSRREGLGIAAIEAMACGLPIVTSNVNGINDYSQEGVTGYKCDPNDVNGFAQAIGRLSSSPEARKQIGQYNREAALQYDVQEIMKKMIDKYEIKH